MDARRPNTDGEASRLAAFAVMIAFLMAACSAAAEAEQAPATQPDQAAIAELVRQLGSDSWQTRNGAQERLIEIGEPAMEEVIKALNSNDLEVRERAQTIAAAIRKNLLEEQSKAILKNTVWKSPIKAGVASPAAVAKGIVCVVTFDWEVLGLDAKTGKAKWNFDGFAEDQNNPGPRIIIGSGSVAAPLIVEGMVYVASQYGRVHALDLETGELKWRTVSKDGFGLPAVAGGVLYVGGVNGGFFALDAANGKAKWRFDLKAGCCARPVVIGDTVCIADREGNVLALDAAGGKKKWQCGPLDKSPELADGGKGVLLVRTADALVAMEVAKQGTQKWRSPLPAATVNAAAINFMVAPQVGAMRGGLGLAPAAKKAAVPQLGEESFLVAGDEVYVLVGDQVFALDAATGKQRRRYEPQLKHKDAAQGGNIVIQGGGAIVLGGQGRLIVTGRGRGTLRPPCVAGEMLYAGSAEGLHAVDLKTGAEVWKIETKEPVVCRPTVAGGVVYFGTAKASRGIVVAGGNPPKMNRGSDQTALQAVRLK